MSLETFRSPSWIEGSSLVFETPAETLLPERNDVPSRAKPPPVTRFRKVLRALKALTFSILHLPQIKLTAAQLLCPVISTGLKPYPGLPDEEPKSF
jgi:hypothetical protein